MPNTIVALATPSGRSGIGVVRLSGDDALQFVRALVPRAGFKPVPRMANLEKVSDPSTGEVIDEAIVTYFKAPRSFTGEDVVEISCHGSPVLLRRIIDICLSLGARMADPGEFSLRALANGRMNLAEAEAIRDLIDAQTVASARQAVRQMRGELSRELQPLKDKLLDVIVVLESALEFVEDDLPDVQSESVKKKLTEIAAHAGRLASTFQAGRLIREGLRVAIVGRPNVGKSSLFNTLLGTDRAIVTDIAGTTRDQLHERFTIGDIPISLIDTAGLRETTDTVESIGVERAKGAMADADRVVVMLDVSEAMTGEDVKIIESVRDIGHIITLNKIDKVSSDAAKKRESEILNLRADNSGPKFDTDSQSQIANLKFQILSISATTGKGLDVLQRAIVEPFAATGDNANSGFLVTDARHHDLLLRTQSEIEQSHAQLDEKLSEEIVLIGLHNALRNFGEITGETTTEDMLTRIFSTFCIGK